MPRPPMATKITWLYTEYSDELCKQHGGDLELVPDNFTITSYNHAFSENSLKGLIYFQEGYIHKVSINKNKDNAVIISAWCFRSTRKGETPHRPSIDLKDSAVTSLIVHVLLGKLGRKKIKLVLRVILHIYCCLVFLLLMRVSIFYNFL